MNKTNKTKYSVDNYYTDEDDIAYQDNKSKDKKNIYTNKTSNSENISESEKYDLFINREYSVKDYDSKEIKNKVNSFEKEMGEYTQAYRFGPSENQRGY